MFILKKGIFNSTDCKVLHLPLVWWFSNHQHFFNLLTFN